MSGVSYPTKPVWVLGQGVGGGGVGATENPFVTLPPQRCHITVLIESVNLIFGLSPNFFRVTPIPMSPKIFAH